MLKSVCPNFKQTTVVQHLLRNDFHYAAHGAKEDAVALEKCFDRKPDMVEYVW